MWCTKPGTRTSTASLRSKYCPYDQTIKPRMSSTEEDHRGVRGSGPFGELLFWSGKGTGGSSCPPQKLYASLNRELVTFRNVRS